MTRKMQYFKARTKHVYSIRSVCKITEANLYKQIIHCNIYIFTTQTKRVNRTSASTSTRALSMLAWCCSLLLLPTLHETNTYYSRQHMHTHICNWQLSRLQFVIPNSSRTSQFCNAACSLLMVASIWQATGTLAIRVDWNTNHGPIVPPTSTVAPVPQPPFRNTAPVWEDQSNDIPNPNPYRYYLYYAQLCAITLKFENVIF